MTDSGSREPGAGLTPEQQRAVEEFKALRGVEPFGPFLDLLASPELMNRVGALGEYLRYRSALPPRLSEFAILITAAHWRQQFEWDIHAPIAAKAGVPQAVIDAIWAHTPPPHLDAGQQVLYDLCITLHRERGVSPTLRHQTQAVLGEQGTIDAIAICGYYALLAMILNSKP
ncbi:MAG: carboxymuconolactone decarboxylase family protein [Cyanobacteria bacterium]|nr:carboxymuconolactone decarboxylase family protein [Cyanobacteriota bacterium]